MLSIGPGYGVCVVAVYACQCLFRETSLFQIFSHPARYFRELLALREQLRVRQQNEAAGIAEELKTEVLATFDAAEYVLDEEVRLIIEEKLNLSRKGLRASRSESFMST